MLRPINKVKAEAMAVACEQAAANDCIGYNQSKRNTLNSQAILVGYDISRIRNDCDCDCSSLMTVCAQAAGIHINYCAGNAPTTRTMKTAFMYTNEFELLVDDIYTNTDRYLLRGDVLVKAGSHTVMALENGKADILPTIKRGSKGNYVRLLQGRLIAKGYNIQCDGDFGANTYEAVKAFQASVSTLEVDGIVGPKTWAELYK